MKAVRAKLFRNGGSQAVQLPKECRFAAQQAILVRRGDRRVILEAADEWSEKFRACLGAWPEDIPRPSQRHVPCRKGDAMVKGVQFVVDNAGRKTAVQIDLKHLGRLWEDFYDLALAKQRASEPRESLDSVKRRVLGHRQRRRRA